MKFIREVKSKIAKSQWMIKLKSLKNPEIIIAVVLALLAIIIYFLISTGGAFTHKSDSASVEMTETEKRVSEMISEIAGVGESRVLITSDANKEVIGVVVVAEGVSGMANRIKIIRLIEKATGATVDQIEIFEMEKGG